MSLFETLTDQSWRVAIARSRAEPNLVLKKINELAMTNYTVTMDDGHKITVKAWNAADAIQIGLIKHIGHRVLACRPGDMSSGILEGHINYEIPNHDPSCKRQRSARESLEIKRPRQIVASEKGLLHGWRIGLKNKKRQGGLVNSRIPAAKLLA